jgi:hypothetical protein
LAFREKSSEPFDKGVWSLLNSGRLQSYFVNTWIIHKTLRYAVHGGRDNLKDLKDSHLKAASKY